jgi:hypothetical protein
MQLDLREVYVTKGASRGQEVDECIERCLQRLHDLGLPPPDEVLVPERESRSALYVPQWTYDMENMRVVLTVNSARDRRVHSIRLSLLHPDPQQAPEFLDVVKEMVNHPLVQARAGYLLLGTRQQTLGGRSWWGVADVVLHDDCTLTLRDAWRAAYLFHAV